MVKTLEISDMNKICTKGYLMSSLDSGLCLRGSKNIHFPCFFFLGSKFVNPLSIDPNERVTPSQSGAGPMGALGAGNGESHHNGVLIEPGASMDDIPDLSIGKWNF